MYVYITTKRYCDVSIVQYGNDNTSTYVSEDIRYERQDHLQIKELKIQQADIAIPENYWNVDDVSQKLYHDTRFFMAHYHYEPYEHLRQVRPLSLTEDYKECIILPILLSAYTLAHDVVRHNYSHTATVYEQNYSLLVFLKNPDGTRR